MPNKKLGAGAPIPQFAVTSASGKKTEAMVFEGKKCLIDYANQIKQTIAASVIKGAVESHSKAASDPNVMSCQPWFS